LPQFAGQTSADATSECNRLHLVCTVVARQPSDKYPQDVIMAQQPNPGAHVREGRAVSFVVSAGIHIFPMPDLRFESLRNVNLKLGDMKLQLAGTSTVANDDIPANYVVSQNPPPLASVREGTAVTVTLSKGPPASVKVPNFVNMPIDAARDAAQAARV